jgi:hypothetical protein
MIAGFPFIASSFDPDARAFVQTSGATDRAALNFFVKGIKRLGLWDDMVCWPLRSAQNAGTGSTAYSLGGLGTYNGTLINGPTWGEDGIAFANPAHIIQTRFTLQHLRDIVLRAMQANWTRANWIFVALPSERRDLQLGRSATIVLGGIWISSAGRCQSLNHWLNELSAASRHCVI